MNFDLPPSHSTPRALVGAALYLLWLSACGTDSQPTPNFGSTTTTNAATMGMLDSGVPANTTGAPEATTTAPTTGGPVDTTGLPATTTGEGSSTGGEVIPTTGTTSGTTGLEGGPTTSGDGGLTTGEVDAGPAPAEDLGKGDGKDVVTIGDSWMNYFVTSGGIEGGLDRAGTSYRHHGVAGTKMLNGQIPGQFDDAVRNNPDIKTVIMTGGGNDVLLEGSVDDCPSFGPTCQMQLMRIEMAISDLLDTMAAAGVLDVVYVGYSDDAGDSAAEASNVTKNGVGDMCAARTDIRCHAIDSTPIIMGGLSLDGIHPTAGSNDKLATAIMTLMEEKGMRR